MEGVKDFHVLDKRTGEYGTRCDLCDSRIIYEFEGGYSPLEVCIESDDFVVTPIDKQLDKFLNLFVGQKWSDIAVLEGFGTDKYITKEELERVISTL